VRYIFVMYKALQCSVTVVLAVVILSTAVEFQVHGHPGQVGRDHSTPAFAQGRTGSPSSALGEGGDSEYCALCLQAHADLPLHRLLLHPERSTFLLRHGRDVGHKHLTDYFGIASKRGPPVASL